MSEIQQTHSEECWRWHGHEKCAQRKVESLLAENSALERQAKEPSWGDFIQITRNWLKAYPPTVFTGASGDPGPRFVAAVRNALETLDAPSTRQ